MGKTSVLRYKRNKDDINYIPECPWGIPSVVRYYCFCSPEQGPQRQAAFGGFIPALPGDASNEVDELFLLLGWPCHVLGIAVSWSSFLQEQYYPLSWALAHSSA